MSNYPTEPEFEQAYKELVSTLEASKLFEKHPDYKKALPVIAIPERLVQFRVVWEDDKGAMQVNRGYRVQFNSVLGPYKGGIRFHPSVNLSILKFLGFEQMFKNALTGVSMGGAKGGSDFDPKGRSDNEIRRFCQGFMRELSKYIGANIDVPAGDIGVSTREVGYMFGSYRQTTRLWEGVLTGKGGTWGGSLIRPEATGYGLIYYLREMIKYRTGGKETLAGKKVAISGSGNVAQYAAIKAMELGGIVLSLSDSKGSLIVTDPAKPFTKEEVLKVSALKHKHGSLSQFHESDNSFKSKFKYCAGARPWLHVGKVEVALPCATQNEVSKEEAEGLIKADCKYLAEGSNMGSTQEAIDVYETHRKEKGAEGLWYAPGKASNMGGVAVSGLEMAQNSCRISWTEEEVDSKLDHIMTTCFETCVSTANEYYTAKAGEQPSLVGGANIAGFIKVVEAMHDQGDWF